MKAGSELLRTQIYRELCYESAVLFPYLEFSLFLFSFQVEDMNYTFSGMTFKTSFPFSLGVTFVSSSISSISCSLRL